MKIKILILISVILFSQCREDKREYESNSDYTFEWDNKTRDFWLHVPENLPNNAPLIFVLHGYGGDGGGFFGFEELANENGFVICSPSGLLDNNGTSHWNANFNSNMTTVDDVGFLSNLAILLQKRYDLNPEKTFVCGMSNGGYMSWSLACNAPEVFKAVASVTGTMSGNDWNDCNPKTLIPVMQISGTIDDVVPMDGSISWDGGWGGAPDIYSIFDFWNNLEECSDLNSEILQFDYLTDVSTYSNCIYNNRLKLYVSEGMGHSWPNFATQEIYNFFLDTNK